MKEHLLNLSNRDNIKNYFPHNQSPIYSWQDFYRLDSSYLYWYGMILRHLIATIYLKTYLYAITSAVNHTQQTIIKTRNRTVCNKVFNCIFSRL